MWHLLLPYHVIEKILSYVDGKTLMNVEQVCQDFHQIVSKIGINSTWKCHCYNEIDSKTLFQIISTLNPHNGNNIPDNWRQIYVCWYSLNSIHELKKWKLATVNISKAYNCVTDLLVHGDCILVLVKYNKNFSIYNRILTVNDQNKIVHKSCRSWGNMFYITPNQDQNWDDNYILLDCNKCKLIGIPVLKQSNTDKYPLMKYEGMYVVFEHMNGHKLYFDKDNSFLMSRTNCSKFQTKPLDNGIISGKTDIEIDFSKPYFGHIGFGNKEFKQSVLGISARSVKTIGNVLLIGTNTGTVTISYMSNDSNIDSVCALYCFQISRNPIVAIDVTFRDDKPEIICCDSSNLYRLTTSDCASIELENQL